LANVFSNSAIAKFCPLAIILTKTKKMEWQTTSKRFVLFIDILGFKDLVARQSHAAIFEKLSALSTSIESLHGDKIASSLDKYEKISPDQSRAITFSDSIIFFSKSNEKLDAFKILVDAHAIQLYALKHGIPIKGAISYGEISVDFAHSLFFGQPIIDAYLLHDDLNVLSIVIDHNAECIIDCFSKDLINGRNVIRTQIQMKFGPVEHSIVRISSKKMPDAMKGLEKLYRMASGKPRIYLDNTKRLFSSLPEQEE
jgi:hypothetical protein